jgi:hypothetical protein
MGMEFFRHSPGLRVIFEEKKFNFHPTAKQTNPTAQWPKTYS